MSTPHSSAISIESTSTSAGGMWLRISAARSGPRATRATAALWRPVIVARAADGLRSSSVPID